MHYHLEIIMPPSKDIMKDIKTILAPFDENDEENARISFFDFFVIGGRWAGTKESCRHDSGKIEQFYKVLQDNKVTVSGLQCGKQTIHPASQIPMVDKIWNNLFPTENGEITPCPFFPIPTTNTTAMTLLLAIFAELTRYRKHLPAQG